MKNIVEKIATEIMASRAKIIDDFCKFYLASQNEEYFLKLKKDDFRRVELVETIESPTKRIYYFRLKKGKLPKICTTTPPTNRRKDLYFPGELFSTPPSE